MAVFRACYLLLQCKPARASAAATAAKAAASKQAGTNCEEAAAACMLTCCSMPLWANFEFWAACNTPLFKDSFERLHLISAAAYQNSGWILLLFNIVDSSRCRCVSGAISCCNCNRCESADAQQVHNPEILILLLTMHMPGCLSPPGLFSVSKSAAVKAHNTTVQTVTWFRPCWSSP